jgi:hypothetical protein
VTAPHTSSCRADAKGNPLRKIGDVLIEQGKLPDALTAYKAALAIAERLFYGRCQKCRMAARPFHLA